jgi:peptidoglycan/LPS O-acetylase OafA/YrhL
MAGTISFGIYLWHSVIFRALDVYGLTIDPVLVILLVISISVVSWYLLEQPMIKTSKRLCP